MCCHRRNLDGVITGRQVFSLQNRPQRSTFSRNPHHTLHDPQSMSEAERSR